MPQRSNRKTPPGSTVIRAFIAIEIDPQIQSGLKELSLQLQSVLGGAPIRWVPVPNIHLTLKFLGDVSLSNLEVIQDMLTGEVSNRRSFEIEVAQLGAFPSTRRPRVVWVGVQAPAELFALQYGIESETNRLGYALEGRKFSPHLTLGRVARTAGDADVRRIGEVIESWPSVSLGKMRVQQVHLFRSDLQPGGAVYTRLFTARLMAVL